MLLWHKRRFATLLVRLVLALAVSSCALAQAGKISLVEPPGPLLPAHLGDFAKSAPAPIGDGLGQLDPAQASILIEDGVRRFERSDYVAGHAHGTITAYQFVDASGAYAAFCANRRPNAPPPTKRIGEATVSGSEGLEFQSGVNLIIARFDLPAAQLNTLMANLIAHLPKVAGPAGQQPLLPTYVPEKGLVSGSIRYALGPSAYAAMGGILPANILAFDKSAEAVTAAYSVHGSRQQGILTLLFYPTPAIAGDESRAIEAYIRSDAAKSNPVPLVTARLRREGPMLILATGGFPDEEAQRLVDSIHLRNELTWNKQMPLEFHAEVQKTASLLTSILIFSGVGGLAAILLGLFLGFGRAGIRVLMGKPAASEPEFLRIDLSSRPSHDLRGTDESART
jgi:hypothetical protein